METTNIALNKTTYMSSTFSNFTSSNKAVDGQKTDLSYSGGQCAISKHGYKTVEWRVDLENLSSISNITIYFRTENSPWGENNGHTSRFLGFSIFISNTTMKEDGWFCFHDNSFYNLTTIPAILTLECIMHGRYVIYYNERKEGQPHFYSDEAIIELCELEVNGCFRGQYGENCTEKCRENCVNDTCDINSGTCFECDVGYREPHCDLECDSGMYGPGCSLTCGACINNTQCHHINGSCLQGCGPGFYGRKCDEGCPFGKYGINCQYNCSAACKSLYNCSRTTGECVDGCQPGWKGFHCDQKCDNRTFGPGCGHKCGECINITQCNNINGICEFGCAPGFLGVTCNEECPFGKYGISCADNCSRNCSTPHNCEGRTGNCVGGCQMGWKGVQCDQECDGRTYGLNCSQTCGACINNSQCHHVSGMCPWGCDNDFQGMSCNEEYFKIGSSCDKNEKCIIDLGISIAISIVIVILGTSLNIAFWRRKSNRLNSKQSQETMVNDDSGNPDINYESTYTELGAVTSKQNTYDDIHHYS